MKLKRLCGLALVGVLTFSSMNVFASDIKQKTFSEVNVEQSNIGQPDVEREVISGSGPVTRATNLVIDEALSGARGSATYSFSTSSSQPHYRIHVNNTSSSDITVTVGGNTYTVKANTSETKVYTSSSIARRDVDITSKDGSALKGNIACLLINQHIPKGKANNQQLRNKSAIEIKTSSAK